MIPLIFKMYLKESKLYRNVDYDLWQFPVQILRKCLKELNGILNYIYLLQSPICECGCNSPIREHQVIYRGLSRWVQNLGHFTRCSLARLVFGTISRVQQFVIEIAICKFVKSSEGILFGITLCAGAVAGALRLYSAYPKEHEVLIAAMSEFMVESIDHILAPQREQSTSRHNFVDSTIPNVKLRYCSPWFDFDIDNRPPTFIVWC
jgi:hypothetical protein